MITFDYGQLQFIKNYLLKGTDMIPALQKARTDTCCDLNADEIKIILTACENTEIFLENELMLSARIRHQSDLTQQLAKTREIKEKLEWNCCS